MTAESILLTTAMGFIGLAVLVAMLLVAYNILTRFRESAKFIGVGSIIFLIF